MIFQPGQKVVCVDDTFDPAFAQFYVTFPVKGQTYTIRGIAPAINLQRQDEIAVYLTEIYNPCSSKAPHRERGFVPERFVPLDELPDVEEAVSVGQHSNSPKELVEV